jgi:hypothetical protein
VALRRESDKSAGRARRPVYLYLSAALMIVLFGGIAGKARGHVEQHAGHPLGMVDFPITCSEEAQVAFNRAVVLSEDPEVTAATGGVVHGLGCVSRGSGGIQGRTPCRPDTRLQRAPFPFPSRWGGRADLR